jgi:hypothetical protein
MPAAIAIPLITGAVSTGATVYAAKKGADASTRAARTQSASADRALAALQPYRALGTGSLANLGNFQSFAGVPGNFGAGVQAQYQHALSPPGPGPQQAVPRDGGTLANPAAGRQPPPPGQTVQMRAPTGEVMPVPADQVAHFRSRGAQVIP